MKYQKLVAIFKILEYRDGCIYRTRFDREEWIDSDTPMYSIINGNEQICSLSSKRQKELNYETMRKENGKY